VGDAVKLEMHRDQLESGIEVETGKTYEFKFGEPLGSFRLVVMDEKNINPVPNEAYKITGPHGVSLDGITGEKGEIDHPDTQVPIDHYTLAILGGEYPLEARFAGLPALQLRIPGFPKADPPPPPLPPAPPPDPNAVKSRPDYDRSPEDLMKKYLHMKFTVEGEEVVIDLDFLKYQNTKYGDDNDIQIPGRDTFDNPDTGEQISREPGRRLKNLVIQIRNALLKERGDDWYQGLVGRFSEKKKVIFPYPFHGKGSPGQIEAVLKIVGTIKGGTTKSGLSLGEFWVDKGSLSESLKYFYLQNMGLDCIGFAGNYARWITGGDGGDESDYPEGTNWNSKFPIPESSIAQVGKMGKKRRAVEEIMMGDLVVWEDGKHIATVLSHSGTDIHFVESNGARDVKGLGKCTRSYAPTGGDLWTAIGGGKGVYIVSFT
jgi:hypothetical protein